MQAVIMAGGKGTRLSAVTQNLIPKPMADFCGKPIIQLLIDNLTENGIKDIIICVGHLGEQIIDYLGDGGRFGAVFHFVKEKEPLGSAGALYYAKEYLKDDFLLVNADLVLDIDIKRMYDFHLENRAKATVFVHPNSHPFDSDIVLKDEKSRVLKFDFKGSARNYDYENCTNAGIVIFSKELLSFFDSAKKLSLEKDVIAALIESGERVFAYSSTEYVKDVGTPERFLAAKKEFESGKPLRRNLKNRQKAVFLDRDGTLNKFKGLITDPSQMELIEGVTQALKRINKSDYLAIVITNQPVLARGECTKETLDLIHKRLFTLLGNAGCFVDDLIYCPHHPDKGFEGEVKELKIDCDCRKPKTGMVNVMAQRYNIDLSASFFIGDTYTDVQTGFNCGMKSILIPSKADDGRADFSAEPDFVFDSLNDALDYLNI